MPREIGEGLDVNPTELITTGLDTLALLLVAAGAGAAVFPVMGWAAAAVSGVVLFGGARLAEVLARRRGGEL